MVLKLFFKRFCGFTKNHHLLENTFGNGAFKNHVLKVLWDTFLGSFKNYLRKWFERFFDGITLKNHFRFQVPTLFFCVHARTHTHHLKWDPGWRVSKPRCVWVYVREACVQAAQPNLRNPPEHTAVNRVICVCGCRWWRNVSRTWRSRDQ